MKHRSGLRSGHRRSVRFADVHLLIVLSLGLTIPNTGCTPTVQVAAPKEPITINLNIKLDADVRLRVEEKAKQDVEQKSIF